jgi:hypothetical protein
MSTKYIRFAYNKSLDRLSAEFLVVEPLDIVTEHETNLSNTEIEFLEEYLDFTRLYNGDAMFVTVKPEDIERVFETSEMDDTNFRDMYDRFVEAK